MKKKFAVIGDPVKHSLSPIMHNAALKSMNIEGDYSAIHVTEEKLPEFVEYARNELDGFNITVPHKKNIIPFLDEISDECKLSESVNTVTIRDGKLSGESTDGYGLETALEEAFDVSIPGQTICFIGCGGAANAVAFYFASKGAKELSFINRTVSKADQLAERLKSNYPELNVQTASPTDAKLADLLTNTSIVIQATSLGLNPDDPAPIAETLLNRPGLCFYDTIYKTTKLLSYARSNSIPCDNGRGMLLHQGARSLEKWTGQQVPVEVMRNALYSEISRRENNH